MNALTPRERQVLGMALAAGIGWQVFQLYWIFRVAPLIGGLATTVGAALLPPATSSFFATYRYWPAAPALSVLLTADLLHRESPSKLHLWTVAALVFGAGCAISLWSLEAVFQPLIALVEKLT